MKKICIKCKEEYHFDGVDWGICPSCIQKMLTEVREKMR